MEHQSRVGKVVVFSAIGRVTDYRMVEVLHVHPELMRSSGNGTKSDEGITLPGRENPI